ncbi:MAG: pilin [Candidatus Pacebacteria bacterium]|nr:pilin [Candidatus Paceibacterota bacterium]
MIVQNIFLKKSISLVIGIFLCVPLLVFGQQTNPATQQVFNPNINVTISVPSSWVINSDNWSSLKMVLNPVTNSWMYVPVSWVINGTASTTGPVVTLQTQQVGNPITGGTLVIPASWNITNNNWSAIRPVYNPVTGSWINVPDSWVIPPMQNNSSNDPFTPGTPGQVPGASSDPLNPGASQTTIQTTSFTPDNTGSSMVTMHSGNRTIRDLLNRATGVLNRTFPILISLATIVFMISIIGLLTNSDNQEKKSQAKNVLIGSIFALFIMISIWGLVFFLSGTFGFEFGLPQLSA